MGYIGGESRNQRYLLPETIDDYIGADNPVRFVDAFVEKLDLEQLGFERAVAAETGRPGYDPGDLLRLYLYGYLNRIRSSRRLEREASRNLELMWLLRRLRPDFKTIADFRRDNGRAIQQVCREFTLVCKDLDLFGRRAGGHRREQVRGGQQSEPELQSASGSRNGSRKSTPRSKPI